MHAAGLGSTGPGGPGGAGGPGSGSGLASSSATGGVGSATASGFVSPAADAAAAERDIYFRPEVALDQVGVLAAQRPQGGAGR